MTNVNDYRGLTDSEIIENALAALDTDRTLLIRRARRKTSLNATGG